MSTTNGSKQHFLPAAYIGRFSNETSPRARERQVYAMRREQKKPFPVTAQNIGAQYDLYTLQEHEEPTFVDALWKYTEDRLNGLTDLENSTNGYLDATIWAESVIPFLAQLFVRHPAYSQDFFNRFTGNNAGALEVFNNSDMANIGRVFDEIHYRAMLTRTYWEVVHVQSGKATFVTNDTGMFLVQDPLTGIDGYGFPLSKNAILMIHRTKRTPPIVKIKGKWYVSGILHRYFDEEDVIRLNMTAAEWSIDTVIGATPEVVKEACFMRSGQVVNLERRVKFLFNKGEKRISYEDVDRYYSLLRRLGLYDNLPVVLYHEPDKTEPSIILVCLAPPNTKVDFTPFPAAALRPKLNVVVQDPE